VKERRAILVSGTVQGVGYRPFVYGLATRMGLGGRVWNQQGDVRIEVEGDPGQVEGFIRGLRDEAPSLARVERISWEERTLTGEREFRIVESKRSEGDGQQGGGEIAISSDVATCPECLRELTDPGDRRFGYPFLNCTQCGPRLTIVTGAPYDRAKTTMRDFVMCDACRAEYENPRNRRFHAEPTACEVCGPRLKLCGADEVEIPGEAIAGFAGAILEGRIGAMKGLGGYHLVCDATDAAAVAELRIRKHRDAKPFAVMVRDLEAAGEICEMSPVERGLLESRRRPIVLLRKKGEAVAEGVAPGNPFLGVMLPYTPLHYLLMEAVNGRPLVMTSGNRSDEPIAYRDEEVFTQLGGEVGIADVYLMHNRPIHLRCDDSVVRVVGGEEMVLRRSRGYAPEGIALPVASGRAILAVGGQLKNTFGLAQGGRAILSQHMGDLDHLAAYEAFERDIALYEVLFEIGPEVIVHDLHPDYASTRYARERAGRDALELIGVQHHYAHMASCMAEHGVKEKVIGVVFDGTGYGVDGAVWGGEFLTGDLMGFERAGHLRYVGLPGGDAAAKEGWRMAVSHLIDAGVSREVMRVHEGTGIIEQMVAKGINTPRTSSMGRLFDAVSALAAVCEKSAFEGQAAMMLEWAAEDGAADYGYEMTVGEGMEVDTRPLISAVAEDVRRGVLPGVISRRFHAGVAEMVGKVAERIREKTGIGTVCLSGGVFMNARLAVLVEGRLERAGFVVLRQRVVPCNDGGIALGQLAVAAARLAGGRE